MSRFLLVVSLLPALAVSGCAQFQARQLYAGIEADPVPERPRTLSLAVEPTIYDDATNDTVWFQDDTRCTQGELTTETVYGGERAVAVSWDRSAEGCEWAGFGFGWDAWSGKDLSEILPYAGVEMYVRSAEGRMYGLPIVLTLEDYSGGMGFAYTANQYFERPFIDEEWQRIVVPLSDFDLEEEHLDPTNVKQLMFELQQSGDILIDEVALVWYEEPEREPWLIEPERPSATALPITLFDDAFINDDGWGLVTDACQSVRTTKERPATGSTALHLRWDITPEQCYRGSMGVSWDQWYPIDLTPVASEAAIQLQVRLVSGVASRLPIQVGLEDYNRQTSQVVLEARYAESERFTTDWHTVTIPVAELRGDGHKVAAAPAATDDSAAATEGQGADLSNVKQFVLFMDDAGEVVIDDIRIVRTDASSADASSTDS